MKQNWLERIIDKLDNLEPTNKKEIVILVCPALSKKRFLKEGKKTIIKRRFSSKYDFIPLQIQNFEIAKDYKNINEIWEDYYEEVVIPTLTYILSIMKNNVDIFRDVTFSQFQSILNEGKYKTIFLVTHHIEKDASIEFADGKHKNSKVEQAIIEGFQKQPASFFPYVCNIGEAQNRIAVELFDKIESFASAFWYVPFTKSLCFIATWISFLDNKNTLLDAYQLAIAKVLKDGC